MEISHYRVMKAKNAFTYKLPSHCDTCQVLCIPQGGCGTKILLWTCSLTQKSWRKVWCYLRFLDLDLPVVNTREYMLYLHMNACMFFYIVGAQAAEFRTIQPKYFTVLQRGSGVWLCDSEAASRPREWERFHSTMHGAVYICISPIVQERRLQLFLDRIKSLCTYLHVF